MAEVQAANGKAAQEGGLVHVRAEWDWNRVLTPHVVLLILPVVALVVWAYWRPFVRWEAMWYGSSSWGHGYLIPVIAVLIAHFRLKELRPQRIEPCLWGILLILMGLILRIWSQTLMYGYPSEVTFLLVAAGVTLFLLGWDMFRVIWISVAYLGLMIPWEPKYYDRVALPLQTLAASATERFLSMVGMMVSREGNVLNLPHGPPVAVAEACSGLHLLFSFVALGVMMAFMYRRPLWERLIIMASSIPIAVFCNIIRVTLMAVSSDRIWLERQAVVTGQPTWSAHMPDFIWTWFKGGDLGARLVSLHENVMNPESFLHQSFGFAMLGLAFVLMSLELRLIDMFFVEEPSAEKPASDSAAGGGSAAGSA